MRIPGRSNRTHSRQRLAAAANTAANRRRCRKTLMNACKLRYVCTKCNFRPILLFFIQFLSNFCRTKMTAILFSEFSFVHFALYSMILHENTKRLLCANKFKFEVASDCFATYVSTKIYIKICGNSYSAL